MIRRLTARMEKWAALGTLRSPDDASRLIGHVPRDYPQAYLFGFFAPRPASEWKAYGMILPKPLKSFYAECNGLNLFMDGLSLYGIRDHYKRDDSAQFQPFDLKSHDLERRKRLNPKTPPLDRVCFGSYTWDGSGVYMMFDDARVIRATPAGVHNTWPTLATFLISEFERMEAMHTEQGYWADPGKPTVPS